MESKKRLLLVFFALFLTSCSSAKLQKTDSQSVFQIPVYFPICINAPVVKVNIEEQELLLALDLGSNAHLKLIGRALDQLKNKELVGVSRSTDIKGNRYEEPVYKIPYFRLGSLTVSDAVAGEENLFFIQEGSRVGKWHDHLRIQDQINKIDGRIGGGLFSSFKYVCYFDMSRLIFCMGPSLDQITNNYPVVDFMKGKFEVVDGLICLNILTDRGMKKFMLDTGAQRSLIQKSSMDGKWVTVDLGRLGQRRFFAFDIPEQMPFDGILGFDFFEDYRMCLDFSNQTIYIKPTD